MDAELQRHEQEDNDRFEAILSRLDSIDKKLDPIVEAYQGILFSRSFVAGLGTLIVGILGIGGAVLYLINHLFNHP